MTAFTGFLLLIPIIIGLYYRYHTKTAHACENIVERVSIPWKRTIEVMTTSKDKHRFLLSFDFIIKENINSEVCEVSKGDTISLFIRNIRKEISGITEEDVQENLESLVQKTLSDDSFNRDLINVHLINLERKMDISLNLIREQYEYCLDLITESLNRKVDCIEYLTDDEYWCFPNILITPQSEYQNDFEAFLTLINVQLHLDEEWKLSETTSENAHLVHQSLLRYLNSYKLTDISSTKIKEKIEYIVQGAQEEIIAGKSIKSDKNYSGIFFNGEKIFLNEKSPFNIPELDQIHTGVSLTSYSNELLLFYKTQENYCYFSWGTGA